MKRIVAIFLCLLIFSGAWTSEAQAPGSIWDNILSAEMNSAGAVTVQQWIDGALAEGAGSLAEWYVLALRQSGDYDFSAYLLALESYLSQTNVRSASTRLKYALTLLSVGGDTKVIASLMETSVGQQGVMSWIFGLHLMNNGMAGDRPAALEALLRFQLPDGGWAVTGSVADVDVTAMAVQALAPDYGRDPRVTAAVEEAMLLLANRQREDGSYVSYGVANPESGAQVLIALSALGVDGLSDQRFIKNGHSILNGILLFQLPDGSFSHILDGEKNENATSQVFLAMTAYERMRQGKPGIWLLDDMAREEKAAISAPETVDGAELGYKPVASIVAVGLATLAFLLLLIRKKRSRKNYLVVLAALALLLVGIWGTDFQSAGEYYSDRAAIKENPVGSVRMSIRCDVLSGKPVGEHIPQDGMVLAEASFPIAEGDTAYTVLTDAARIHGLRVETSGAAGLRYVTGIQDLFEFDFGDLSGWLYRVNGQIASLGCEQFVLADGDLVEWLYSCEMGNDLDEGDTAHNNDSAVDEF